eukprot:TRINITY_DN1998_c0_g1_i1.p1 TRINITY_DN1998_c0_g1~~TRINITY_DN1998_c0_g1_i1.p1  ORF type:complete len:133 (+),score=28.27 TRINITY_DN1998_c0_g1_i1:100-498(+)
MLNSHNIVFDDSWDSNSHMFMNLEVTFDGPDRSKSAESEAEPSKVASKANQQSKHFVPNSQAREFVPNVNAKEFVPNVQAKAFVPTHDHNNLSVSAAALATHRSTSAADCTTISTSTKLMDNNEATNTKKKT